MTELRVVPKPEDELVLYIIARKDLKMSPGKLAAQVGHGVHQACKLGPQARNPQFRVWYNKWDSSKSYTKIVLAVESEGALMELEQQIPIPNALIEDEGRTEFGGEVTMTVLALVPVPKSFAFEHVGHLPLYR